MSPAGTALKSHDSLVAVLFAGRVAGWLVPAAVRIGISPNAITVISFVLSSVAALLIAIGDGDFGLLAAALVAAGFVADCLDGQVARVTGRTSDFGAYFDAMTDLVKVFSLLIATAVAARGGAMAIAAWSFLWFALCQHHVHVVRPFPQRGQSDYEAEVAPWKGRLVFAGQRIDFAFAIGEVLGAIAVGAALARPWETLLLLAIILPPQFASYAIRFWRHRYRR